MDWSGDAEFIDSPSAVKAGVCIAEMCECSVEEPTTTHSEQHETWTLEKNCRGKLQFLENDRDTIGTRAHQRELCRHFHALTSASIFSRNLWYMLGMNRNDKPQAGLNLAESHLLAHSAAQSGNGAERNANTSRDWNASIGCHLRTFSLKPQVVQHCSFQFMRKVEHHVRDVWRICVCEMKRNVSGRIGHVNT